MNILEKITISNVRKFSENVEIPISRGATVFLAPNGTGKTAIFEAIELALTGAVKRLSKPPNALIRDNKTSSFIRLDFEDGKFCEVDFKKGATPILKGDHLELFGSIPNADVPFLLRLTHLLSQKNSEWFVETQGTVAGEQLDHLSIGRDAVQANSLMTSAKKAANAVIEQTNRALDDAKQLVVKWNELKDQRKASSTEVQENLTPREDLLFKTNEVSKILGQPLIDSSDINNLITQVSLLEGLLGVDKDRFDTHKTGLQSLSKTIEDFKEIIRSQETENSELNDLKESKRKLADEISKLRESFLSISNLINMQEERLIHLNSIKDIQRSSSLINQEIDALTTSIEKGDNLIEEIKKKLKNASIQLKSAIEISDIYKKLNERIQTLAFDELVLSNNTKLIEDWDIHNGKLLLLQGQQKTYLEVFETKKRIVDNLRQGVSDARDALDVAQRNFDSLNSTSDIIKNAIGHIASHITAETMDCPLCLQHFEPGELQSRVSQALLTLNPLLSSASNTLDIEKGKLTAAQSLLDSASSEFVRAEAQVVNNRSEIGDVERTISSRFVLKIYNATSLQEAIIKRNEAIERNRNTEQEIVKDLKSQKPEIPVDPLQKEFNDLDKTLKGYEEKKKTDEENFKSKEKTKITIDLRLEQLEKIDDIDTKLAEQEILIKKLKDQLEAVRRSQDNSQRILFQTNDVLSKVEDNINKLSIRLNDLRTRWANNGIINDLTIEQLTKRLNEIDDSLKGIDNNLKRIQPISLELKKWKSIEGSLNAEKVITGLIGKISESEYEMKLNQSVDELQKEMHFLDVRNSTLNSFSKNVATQLDNIHTRIASINPLWKKLLTRIVLEPRFAETKLDSYLYYKKAHANVNVILHGEEVVASHIASEAQITDLQFTFLLAMAQTYQWSPWRALLLDDPTQHHDLVHASAVFDLLRDYIIDHNFQVLLATHDSVQANFFVRKLENDGIPTRLYRLKSFADGVRAEAR